MYVRTLTTPKVGLPLVLAHFVALDPISSLSWSGMNVADSSCRHTHRHHQAAAESLQALGQ